MNMNVLQRVVGKVRRCNLILREILSHRYRYFINAQTASKFENDNIEKHCYNQSYIWGKIIKTHF